MNLSTFLKIIDMNLGDKIPVDPETGKRNQANSTKVILYSFVYFDEKDDVSSDDFLELDDEMLRKIFSGSEKLPKDIARKIHSNIDFSDFEELVGYPFYKKQDLIREFDNYGIEISDEDFFSDLANLLDKILLDLISNEKKPSIREAVIEGDRVKVKNKYIKLPPELIPTPSPESTEQVYVEALLEVYAQAEHIKKKITLADLTTMNKEYSAHFKVQRNSYYAALSLLRRIRDSFGDGENEFEKLKNEISSGIEDELVKTQINAYSRVKHILHFVVSDLPLTKSYLGKDTSEWIGAQEKKGIIHILVNDGKVIWIRDYDTDI